jgi:hypothetical protein
MKKFVKAVLLNYSFIIVAIAPIMKLVIGSPDELIGKFTQLDFTVMKSVIKISAISPSLIEAFVTVGAVLVPAILIFFIGKMVREEISDYSKAVIIVVSMALLVPFFDHSKYTLPMVTLSVALYTAWVMYNLFFSEKEKVLPEVLDYPISN